MTDSEKILEMVQQCAKEQELVPEQPTEEQLAILQQLAKNLEPYLELCFDAIVQVLKAIGEWYIRIAELLEDYTKEEKGAEND